MKYLRNILVAATFFGFIPTLYIGNYLDLKLKGIWVALVVWIAFRAIALIYKFKVKYYPLAKSELVNHK